MLQTRAFVLTVACLLGSALSGITGQALAAEEEAVDLAEEAPAAEAPAEPTEKPTKPARQDTPARSAGNSEETQAAVDDALDQGSTELPGKTYLFLGARYRAVFIPQFVQNAFAEGGKTLLAHTPGLEFAIRNDGFEFNIFAMLGFYGLDNVPFKGKGDEELAWEMINFDYQILTLGSDFMWSTDEFAPGLSLVYGAGAGLGLVFGNMSRIQAYPENGTPGDPSTYLPCQGERVPNPLYCDDTNDHYGDYTEPTWADGGSSPLIFPWLAAQVGLRYKVSRQFVMRVEAGVMATGAFLGVAGSFGL